MINPHSFMVAMPEIQVMIFGLVLTIAAAVYGARVTRHIGILAIAAFFIATITMFMDARLNFLYGGAFPIRAFHELFIDDSFARFVKAVILLASSLSILLSWSWFEKEGQERPEYPVLVLFATLGMMLMVSASDFLSLYVGLELQSLALYVLAAFRRDDSRSSEAGLKYFVLGALSSGILLYGISLIYGFAGTTNFGTLATTINNHAHIGVVVGMVFVMAGLAFKISGVPFHMWAPDVYEGAPTPVTAFFASAPKLAAFALLVRTLLSPMAGLGAEAHQIIVFISVASMILGSFAGLVQANIKRLLAYSSIANVGTMLVGLVAGGKAGVQAILIYFTIYALTVLGAFAVVICLRRRGRAVESIVDLSGLSKTNPLVALAMAILMFSLAGIPPLAGFFGKYFVFLAAVQANQIPLAIIGVLTSVVSAYYYLRIIKIMYFDEPLMAIDPLPDWGVRAVLAFSSLSMIAITLVPQPLVNGALAAAKAFGN